MELFRTTWIVAASCLLAPPAAAQFGTVINVPPTAAPAAIESDTQLNLGPGGSLANVFNAGATDGSSTHVEVNITGGTTGYQLTANGGSTINISGGMVGSQMKINNGGVVNVTGGSVDSQPIAYGGGTLNIFGGIVDVGVTAKSGGTVNVYSGPISTFFSVDVGGHANLFGGEFRLDGQLIPGLGSPGTFADVVFADDEILTGTLTDGTPFAIALNDGDSVSQATVRIHVASLPAIGPALIDAAVDPIPKGIRDGQTMWVGSGANVASRFAAGHGSTVHIAGGVVGHDMETDAATVTLASGELGGSPTFFNGSQFLMTGGVVQGNLLTLGNSHAAITGGSVEGAVYAGQGSTVNISNATVNYDLIVWPGSTMNFSGTATGKANVQESTLNITGGSIGGFSFIAGNVNMTGGNVGNSSQNYIMSTGEFRLAGGTVGNNFSAGNDARIAISGGALGANLKLFNASKTAMSAGSIGDNAALEDQATLNVTGGSLGESTSLADSSRFSILGGSIGDHLTMSGDSAVLAIAGGTVGNFVEATRGRVHISGGTIGEAFHTGATSESRVNIYGKQFLLGGQPIAGLVNDVPKAINNRNVTLTGILLDGTPFSFDLNSTANPNLDFFSSSAQLTIQLVTKLQGDYNSDGVVDGGDYVVWRSTLGQQVGNGFSADGDFNGFVDDLDFAIWRKNFGRSGPGPASGASTAVPEPGTAYLVMFAVAVLLCGRTSTGYDAH